MSIRESTILSGQFLAPTPTRTPSIDDTFHSLNEAEGAKSESSIDPDSSEASDILLHMIDTAHDPRVKQLLDDLKDSDYSVKERIAKPTMSPDGTPDSDDDRDSDEIISKQSSRVADDSTEETPEDQDNGPQDVVQPATALLQKLRQAVQKIPPGVPGRDELVEMCDATDKVLTDVAEQLDVPPLTAVGLPELRQSLQQTANLLLRLKDEEKAQLAAPSPKSPTLQKNSAQGTTILHIQQTISGMKSAHEALLHYKLPTEENRKQLSDLIDTHQTLLTSIQKQSALSASMKAEVVAQLTSQLYMLKAIRQQLYRYGSPHSIPKRIAENRVYTDAAVAIFSRVTDQVPPAKKGRTAKQQANFDDDAKMLVEMLTARSKTMASAPRNGSKLPSPKTLDKTIYSSPLMNRILDKYGQALGSIDPDQEINEKKLMARIIDAFLQEYPNADTRSGMVLLANAKSWVLNEQRDWAVIESEVLVPVGLQPEALPSSPGSGDATSPVTLATVKTVTTPVGHIFNNGEIQIVSDKSPVTEQTLGDYQRSDPDNPGTIITTGRNSHATTEHAHGVNVAVTESSVGTTQLFAGTRHGTLSAYDIYPDSLKNKSKDSLEQMAKGFMSQGTDVSRIYTSWDAAGSYDPTQANTATKTTVLDKEWAEAMEPVKTAEDFVKKAQTDEKFCELLRRRAALNRAREVFLAEVLRNPKMQEKIRTGETVDFNSISLITPDLFRNFLARLMPSKFRRHDELTMRREEMQGWQDLREELAADKLEINGMPVKANIVTFSVGVNRLSLGIGNWLVRALTSGWNTVADENGKAIKNMMGDPSLVEQGTYGGQLGRRVTQLEKTINEQDKEIDRFKRDLDQTLKDIASLPSDPARRSNEQQALLNTLRGFQDLTTRRLLKAQETRRKAQNAKDELEQLGRQLAAMWQDGSYRHAGDQPYKFAARLALLSFRLGAGTAFNCKSGKDRTAQLDLEIKLLAFQCESRRGNPRHVDIGGASTTQTVLPPYEGRTDLDRYQLQSFIFQDVSRTVMQRYNTGVEGSKLNYWKALYDSFLTANTDADHAGSEFTGRSGEVAS